MKWILILLLFVSCSPTPQNNHSSSSETPEAGRIYFADNKVSFVPPPSFQPLTQEQIDKKYPKGNSPKQVFANESQSVSVAVTFSPAKVSPDQLQKLKESFEELLPRMVPGLQWQTREFVEINGIKWVHFKLTSNAIDTDIQNHMYITSFEGKALIFAFNSIVSEYDEVKTILDESKNSIKVKQ